MTGTAVKKYYAIAGQIVAMRDAPGPSGLQYFLTDHLGSIVGVMNDTGTLTSQQRFLPFGELRGDVGSITQTDYSYTGQRANSYIKLLDYRSRWYDPDLQRFISPDSIIPNTTTPQAWNRFSYVGNSPIAHNDPTGHCEESDLQCLLNLSQTNPYVSIPSGSGGGSGTGDDSPSHRRTCDEKCRIASGALTFLATTLDAVAMGVNYGFAAVADIPLFLGQPEIYALVVAAYSKGLAIVPNGISTLATTLWIADSFVTQESEITVRTGNNSVTVSGSISQDAITSFATNTAGWAIPEPNVAAAVDTGVILYDLGRELDGPVIQLPKLLGGGQAWPIPTVIRPSFSFTLFGP